MALLYLGEDPWLLEHESCEKLHRDIMELLTERQKFSRSSDRYLQLSATVRLRIKQYNNEVAQLNQKLDTATNSGAITLAESERRVRQVEVLHSKAIQLQKIFDNQVVSKMNEDRVQLMGAGSSQWGNSGVGDDFRDDNGFKSVTDLQQNQKRMLGDQERGLENLSQIISRQKDIANTISNEVDYHSEILDGLQTQIDRTDHRVRSETTHIGVVGEKDKTCVYWVIIIILLVSIIVVASI